MNKELYIVDETGKIIDTIESSDRYVKLSEGDRVLKKGQINYLKDTKTLKYRFIKINPLMWSEVAYKYPIVSKLIYYLGYMDNVLTYNNGKLIQVKNVHEICGISISTAKRQLTGLFNEDIFHKKKIPGKKATYIVVNPYLAMRGKKISIDLYREFELSEWRNKYDE